MTSETNTETKPKADRRKSILDLAKQTLTIIEADGKTSTVYDAAQLPRDVSVWLMLSKLGDVIRARGDFAKLVAGEIPTRVSKVVEINPWRQAIANVLVNLSKKSVTPLTPETALDMALAMTPGEVHSYKVDPDVVTAYGKLTSRPRVSVLEAAHNAAKERAEAEAKAAAEREQEAA